MARCTGGGRRVLHSRKVSWSDELDNEALGELVLCGIIGGIGA